MRFIADGMLGRLSRWLRLMGCDVLYGDFEDDFMLAGAGGRTLLTRDRMLARRAEKAKVPVVLLKSTGLKGQLAQVVVECKIALHERPLFSRCPLCNSEIEEVERGAVTGLVPGGALRHERFWKCENCGKVYWEGGHWKNIKEVVCEIKKGEEDVQNPDG